MRSTTKIRTNGRRVDGLVLVTGAGSGIGEGFCHIFDSVGI